MRVMPPLQDQQVALFNLFTDHGQEVIEVRGGGLRQHLERAVGINMHPYGRMTQVTKQTASLVQHVLFCSVVRPR
jgi:hypothetical protein